MLRRTSCSSMRRRRSTARGRSARRATAWAARSRCGPPPPCRSASAPAASFHGGGLVTDKPDSPHLLAPRVHGRVYIGIATNDDQRQPDAKDKLQGGVRRGEGAGRGRGLPREARLVRARHAVRGRSTNLQRARRRARVGQAGRVVRGGAGVVLRAPGRASRHAASSLAARAAVLVTQACCGQ